MASMRGNFLENIEGKDGFYIETTMYPRGTGYTKITFSKTEHSYPTMFENYVPDSEEDVYYEDN